MLTKIRSFFYLYGGDVILRINGCNTVTVLTADDSFLNNYYLAVQ